MPIPPTNMPGKRCLGDTSTKTRKFCMKMLLQKTRKNSKIHDQSHWKNIIINRILVPRITKTTLYHNMQRVRFPWFPIWSKISLETIYNRWKAMQRGKRQISRRKTILRMKCSHSHQLHPILPESIPIRTHNLILTQNILPTRVSLHPFPLKYHRTI